MRVRDPATITVDGDIAVALRRHPRARRMTLRVARAGGTVTLTLPPRAALAEALAFAQSRAEWLRAARAALPETRRAVLGAALPVEGEALILTPAPLRRATREGDRLLVPAHAPGAAAQALLRQIARDRLAAECDAQARRLGRGFRALVLRDTRSRWGSCTADGRLMFSWRLAMAPPAVLAYVAAHEVAHLAHLDHSPQFWATVERLMPGHAPHRQWLRREGAALHAWSFADAPV